MQFFVEAFDAIKAVDRRSKAAFIFSSEVDAPPSGRYDSAIEAVEHTVDEWKGARRGARLQSLDRRSLGLIYNEIKNYETAHDIFGGAGPHADLRLLANSQGMHVEGQGAAGVVDQVMLES